MNVEELKEIAQDLRKYGEGIVGQHARRLLHRVCQLELQLTEQQQRAEKAEARLRELQRMSDDKHLL